MLLKPSVVLNMHFFVPYLHGNPNPQVEVERRPWLYEDHHGQQVGGFVKEFDNIAFLTVKVSCLRSGDPNQDVEAALRWVRVSGGILAD